MTTVNIDKEDFTAYEGADCEVKQSREMLQQALDKRSGLVQIIVEKYGSGPFEFKGKQLSAVQRKEKDEDGNDTGRSTFYFKAPRGRVIKVE